MLSLSPRGGRAFWAGATSSGTLLSGYSALKPSWRRPLIHPRAPARPTAHLQELLGMGRFIGVKKKNPSHLIKSVDIVPGHPARQRTWL